MLKLWSGRKTFPQTLYSGKGGAAEIFFLTLFLTWTATYCAVSYSRPFPSGAGAADGLLEGRVL